MTAERKLTDLTWVGPATEAFDQWVAEHQKNGTTFDALSAWLEVTKRDEALLRQAREALQSCYEHPHRLTLL